MRTLDEWLAHQQAQHSRTIDLGLERVAEVALRLGLLPAAMPVVLVGGTNGKGSTVAFLTAIAREAGLRVGTYTSPHLVRYAERVALDGEPVDERLLLESFERIEAERREIPLTFFEYGTLAAYDIFRHAAVDLAVVEVGLGGRLDATNIVDADVAVRRGADGERCCEQDLVTVLASGAGERGDGVHVGRAEHPGLDEWGQALDHLGDDESALHAVTSAPASRPLSASTRPAGGSHANTPDGVPSVVVGVSGPTMPRTNR